MAEPAYAVDIGGARRLAKLVGQAQGRPVYAFQGSDKLFAMIDSLITNNAYAWHQVDPAANGGWVTTPGGWSGTVTKNPAYEKNNNPNVPIGKVVDLEVGFNNQANPPGLDFRFDYCVDGGGGGPAILN